jgi:glycosyltransferase involved in cell wall biosynthesis
MWNCIATIPTRIPLQAVYCWFPALTKKIVINLLKNSNVPDLIHVEHLRGARYGIYLKSALDKSNLPTPIVWDSVDCISYLFQQATENSLSNFGKWITRFDLPRTRYFEAMLLDQFKQVLITSKIDKQAIMNLHPEPLMDTNISVIPNGVDLDYFHMDREKVRESATLVFSGKMSYHANVTMALYLVNDIMPLIWAKRQNVKLWIVGKHPPKNIQILGDNPAITVTGTVDDIRPFLQEATVAVVPLLYGAGSQLKVFEAMACATPVVATPRAVSALNVQHGQDLLISQEPDSFAESVISLLDNPDHSRKIGQSGRKYVEEHHDWGSIATQLEGIYHEITCT